MCWNETNQLHNTAIYVEPKVKINKKQNNVCCKKLFKKYEISV